MTEGHEGALDAPAPERAAIRHTPPEVTPVMKPHRELTARAIAVAIVVAALMGAAEPVVVLRIGYGPNISAGSGSAGFALARQALGWIPETINFTFLSPHAEALRLGSEIGVLSLGAGLLIGLRVTLSMFLGTLLAWVIAPEPLFRAGLVPQLTFNMVLQRWIMWPATGQMVAG